MYVEIINNLHACLRLSSIKDSGLVGFFFFGGFWCFSVFSFNEKFMTLLGSLAYCIILWPALLKPLDSDLVKR